MHFGELNLTIAWDIIIIFSGASRMACVSFIYDSCIRGYHEYKSIWDASVGGVLCCSREIDNPHDDHAVTVIRRGVTVGHVPRYVSRGFSLFLQLGGTMHYCNCCLNQKIFKRPSTGRNRNSVSIHTRGANQ